MPGMRLLIIASTAVLLTAAGIAVPRIVADRLVPMPVASGMPPPAHAHRTPLAAPDTKSPREVPDDARQRIDLRGNEITRPVARYRVDARGTLYEVHSPQTEVPRLKAPIL
jgi:hypothetical protein